MIKKLSITYILVTLWLIVIPATLVYVAGFSLLYLINPIELFDDITTELDIDLAWNWPTIKRAFAR